MNLFSTFSLACVLSMASAASAAAPSVPGLDEVMRARDDFRGLAAGSEQDAAPPRRADPAVADVLARLGDTRALTAHAYTVDDIGRLLDVCGAVTEVSVGYALSGLQQRIEADTAPAEAARRLQGLAEENSARYRDEIAALLPFLVRCATVQLPLMAGFFGTLPTEEVTPVRLGGLRQAQAGTATMYTGALAMLADAGLRQDDRARLQRELVDAAPAVSQMLPLEVRLQMLAQIVQFEKQADQALRPVLESIRQSFAEAGCEGLCAAGGLVPGTG